MIVAFFSIPMRAMDNAAACQQFWTMKIATTKELQSLNAHKLEANKKISERYQREIEEKQEAKQDKNEKKRERRAKKYRERQAELTAIGNNLANMLKKQQEALNFCHIVGIEASFESYLEELGLSSHRNLVDNL
jgi:uncharacterized protein YeaO (DUF488 family)